MALVAGHPSDRPGREPHVSRPHHVPRAVQLEAAGTVQRSERVQCLQPGDRLLPGHESDSCSIAHVPGRRRSVLGTLGALVR